MNVLLTPSASCLTSAHGFWKWCWKVNDTMTKAMTTFFFFLKTLCLTGGADYSWKQTKRVATELFLALGEWMGADELNHDKTPHAYWFTLSPGKEDSLLVRNFLDFRIREVEKHVAALCLSAWYLSCTHTAHVPPPRGSAHIPQESGITFNPSKWKESQCSCAGEVWNKQNILKALQLCKFAYASGLK